MPHQVLLIEPQNELKFKVDFSGLFQQGFTTHMRLTNPTTDTVLFKIKTTAPKMYCVRPNSGVLDPNCKVDIAITPQPVYLDNNEKHKHKFMVQSVIAPEGKTSIDQVWKEISPEQLMDYKLKCVFETPRGANDAGDNVPTEANKKRVAVADEAKQPASSKESTEGFILNEAKRKIDFGVVCTSTPKKNNNSKLEGTESDMQNVAYEVIQLREEGSKLRHENLQMKEELLRLRQASVGDGKNMSPHSYSPEKNTPYMSMQWIGVSILMAVFGIIIGKFFM